MYTLALLQPANWPGPAAARATLNPQWSPDGAALLVIVLAPSRGQGYIPPSAAVVLAAAQLGDGHSQSGADDAGIHAQLK